MMKRTVSQEKWIEFLLYVLSPTQANGGWIRPEQISQDLGLGRATTYRYIERAEKAGLAMQVNMKRGPEVGAGIRTMLMTILRPADSLPISERRKPKAARGRKNQKGRIAQTLTDRAP
jgi:hypothetical protein